MRYFKQVALWKIVLLNIIVGACMSGILLLGIVFWSGLLTTPAIKDRLLGALIFIFILFVILFSNYLLWKYSKKQLNGNVKSENQNIKATLVKMALILIVLLLALGSFFVLPNIWIRLNGWWF